LYYWVLQQMFDVGYPKVIKITDLFTASEHSSFWGGAAQRLGLQQDKVMTFLASIGKMVKELFQLVREMRWIDERMGYYEGAKRNVESAEITLKGIWVDMVDGVAPGGQKTNVNLFLMAQQLQFVTLPDFFFSAHPKTFEDVDRVVDKLEVNQAVKRVLKRKLFAYIRWRDETYKELETRRLFTLRYLRQHFNIIKMYMNWVKPYLKHIERLQTDVSKLNNAELIAAFEGSLVDIEVMGVAIPEGNKDYYNCMLVNFEYRSRPSMQYQQEYAHRGPLHLGETKITWRSYTWTWEQIQNYTTMKDQEDFELLASIDASLKEAMEALGDDLQKYLKEAGERIEPKPEEKRERPRLPSIWEPFIDVGKSFIDLGKMFIPTGDGKKSEPKDELKIEAEKKKATGAVKKTTWLCYKNFKKAHGMVTW